MIMRCCFNAHFHFLFVCFFLKATYGAADELSGDEMNLKMLMSSVPGTPGEDYPIYSEVPETEFSW